MARAKFTIAKGVSAKNTKDLGVAKALVAAKKIDYDSAEEDRAKAGTTTSTASTAAKTAYDSAKAAYATLETKEVNDEKTLTAENLALSK